MSPDAAQKSGKFRYTLLAREIDSGWDWPTNLTSHRHSRLRPLPQGIGRLFAMQGSIPKSVEWQLLLARTSLFSPDYNYLAATALD